MWPAYRHWSEEDLLKALIEFRLDKTDESFRNVWFLVSLRAETCADLLGCVENNAELVH